MMKVLHDSIIRLYREGYITTGGLNVAVEKGWITAEEAESLKAERV